MNQMFGERLSTIRIENGLSQKEFSEILFVSKSTVAMYETNQREPSFQILQRLVDNFNVTLDYLILGKTRDEKAEYFHIELPIKSHNHEVVNYIEKNHEEIIDNIKQFMFRRIDQNKSMIEKYENEKEYVYFIKEKETNSVKIGKTKNVKNRFNQLQTSTPKKLEIIKVVKGGYKLERELHKKFEKYRLHGEWFNLGDELLQFIEAI